MTEAMRHKTAVLVTVVLVAAVVAIGTPVLLRGDSARTSSTPSPHFSETTDALRNKPIGLTDGSTGQGTGSGADTAQLQSDAQSAWEQIASGDGLRVENKTGELVILTFPNGDTASVAAGKAVTILRSCRDSLPLRAERKNGEFIAERDGPCRRRDTWILT